MSKAIVNMTPNPLDIQTIHCSQGDTEAREWGFELHNNGEKIDSSSISDQLVFKAYEGGTEEILPTNGSTPTTSPFKGDIKYPQGLLTDQEFLYRQSPTEEDGLAKITDIKGNTLVWNQLCQNTNIPTSQTKNGVTLTNNNDGSWTLSGTATANTYFYGYNGDIKPIVGHKYLMKDCVPNGVNSFYCIFDGARIDATQNNSIITATATTTGNGTALQILSGVTVNVTFCPQIFDLTAMGLDTLTDDEVKQWFADYFPLPYYQYDSGSLLPFRGEGLKTVGFNQWDEETRTDGYFSVSGYWQSGTYVSSENPIPVFPNTIYYLCEKDDNAQIYVTQWTEPVQSGSSHPSQFIRRDGVVNYGFITAPNCHAIHINCGAAYGNVYKNNICINIDDPSKNGTYEPYTESTLSLPISTYFPNGMNGVNDVHDELRENGTTLKMYMVNLGTLNWNAEHENTSGQFRTGIVGNIGIPIPKYNTNFICSKYANGGLKNYLTVEDKTIAYTNGTAINPSSSIIRIHDSSCASMTASEFKESLQNVYLCYQLETPIETSFTTASLVTENAEIPLSNEDGVLVGKCTEELSAEPGFHDAKIKLTDADGECYSNKIQLHVERSPQ